MSNPARCAYPDPVLEYRLAELRIAFGNILTGRRRACLVVAEAADAESVIKASGSQEFATNRI